MKKTSRLLLAIVFTTQLIAGLGGLYDGLVEAQAAQPKGLPKSLSWVDNATLKGDNGQLFRDSKIDTKWSFEEIGSGDGCPDKIDELTYDPDSQDSASSRTPSDDTVKYHERTMQGSSCGDNKTFDLKVSQAQNAQKGFKWVNSELLVSADERRQFRYDTAQKIFINTTDDDSVCSDILSGASGGSATLVVKVGRATGSPSDVDRRDDLRNNYGGYTFVEDIDYDKETNDGKCVASDPLKVTLGEQDKASAPPGSNEDGLASAKSAEDNSCASRGAVLGWIICPVLDFMNEQVQSLDSFIQNILSVPDEYINDPNIEALATRFRNVAYVVLIPIMLVMVLGTALGFEFVSAYTVKKALPRLAIAIIFMALAFPLCKFLVVLTNEVGGGIHGLITSQVAGSEDFKISNIFQPDGQSIGTSVGAGALAIGVGLAFGSIGILFSFLFVTLLGLLMGLILLAFRQFLIVALMLLAPLAILSWIFPSNDKMWKLWWGTFSKLLLLFPIIMVLIASGKVFAYVVDAASTSGTVATLIKVIAYVGPYFLIPSMFKLAGGAFATISGMANDRSKGVFDRQKKYRGQKAAQNFGKTRNYSRFSDKSRLGRGLNTALGAGFNPRDITRGRAGIRTGRQTGKTNQGIGAMKDDKTFNAFQNDDNFLLALADEELAEQKLAKSKRDLATATTPEERNSALADIDARQRGLDAARRVPSHNSIGTRQAALMGLAKTGYQFSAGEEGYKELSNVVDKLSGGDASVRSAMMNEAQFHLKSAGRFDQGGINNGAGYDAMGGISKGSLYAIANGKKESVTTMGTHHSQLINEAKSGYATNPDGTTRSLTAGEVDERLMKATIADKEIEAMIPNATGGVRDELLKQQAALRSAGGKEFSDWKKRASGETLSYRDATGATKTRQLSMDEIATRRARNYERPDPNKIT